VFGRFHIDRLSHDLNRRAGKPRVVILINQRFHFAGGTGSPVNPSGGNYEN
jgi:hypothetical protein